MKRQLLFFGVILLVGMGWFFWQRGKTAVSADQPIPFPAAPEVDPGAIDDLLPRDSIPAIDNPQYEPAAEATGVRPDERVIGLVINGDARAYPIPILSNHEVVNDVVGGEPVAITWCPLCYTALVISRRVAGRDEPLTFGVSGKLLYNTLIMYDRETGSLWSQLYGTAVSGPLAHTTLTFFPSQFTEWAAWLEQYPDSQVLSKRLTCQQFNCGNTANSSGGGYEVDPYAGYYNTPDAGVINDQIPRDPDGDGPKKRVLGVRVGGVARAYPHEILTRTPLINDSINGVPLLIWFDTTTQTGAAFIRRVDGQTYTFRTDGAFLVDEETGSQWKGATGTAVSGPRRNTQLPALIAVTAFEFGWYDYFPASETYVTKDE